MTTPLHGFPEGCPPGTEFIASVEGCDIWIKPNDAHPYVIRREVWYHYDHVGLTTMLREQGVYPRAVYEFCLAHHNLSS